MRVGSARQAQRSSRVEKRMLRGWFIWGAGALFFAYVFFHRVAPSVMFDHLMRDFMVSAAVLGNLSACYFYAYAGMQIPAGMILDRWGPRLLLAVAALVCALGSAMFAAAEQLSIAYLARLLIGAGSGVVFIGTLKLAILWLSPNRFALVTGLTQAIAMLGAVAGQAPLAALVNAIGWRQSMLWGAALGAALAVVIWLCTRDRGKATAQHVGAGALPMAAAARRVLGHPQTWLVMLYSAFMSSPMLAFAVLWGVPYLMQAHGLPRTGAGAGASLMLLGWAVGAPLIGWLSDRMRRRKPVMVACSGLTLLGWLLILGLPQAPLPFLYVLFVAVGASSSSMALTFALGRELNPPQASGLATAVVNMPSIMAGAVLQPLVGWLLDLQWDGTMQDGVRMFAAADYLVAFLPFPIVTAVTFLSTFFIRETYCRQQPA